MDSEDMGKTCVGTTLLRSLVPKMGQRNEEVLGELWGVELLEALPRGKASPAWALSRLFSGTLVASPHGWVPVPTFHCNPRVGTLGEITPSVH